MHDHVPNSFPSPHPFCSSGLPGSASGTWSFAMRCCIWRRGFTILWVYSMMVYDHRISWWSWCISYKTNVNSMLINVNCNYSHQYPDAFKKEEQKHIGITVRSYICTIYQLYMYYIPAVANLAGPAQFQPLSHSPRIQRAHRRCTWASRPQRHRLCERMQHIGHLGLSNYGVGLPKRRQRNR